MKVTAAALMLCASAVSASEVYGHSPYSGMHRRHVGMMMASTNNDEHRPLRPRHAAAPIDTSAKMIRRIKREPLVVHGSIPVLGTGVQPIIGLTQLNKHDLAERGDDTMHDHNGNQGWNEANVLAASTSSGDDDEDCEEEDDQQAGTGSADDEECEADDDDDSDLEDCDEDGTDSTQTQSGTSNTNSGNSNSNNNNGSTQSSTSNANSGNSNSGSNNNNGAVQDVKVAASSKSSAPTTTSAMFAPKTSAAPSTSAAPKSVSNAQSSNNNAQNNNNNAQNNNNNAQNNNNNNNSDSKKQTSSSNSNGQVFTGGIATFYEQNGNAGACGEKHPDSDKIIALPTALWNNGKNCGRSVSIKDTKTGKTVSAVVKDLCPSCESGTSIDLSIGAMSALLDDFKTKGIAHIEWSFTS